MSALPTSPRPPEGAGVNSLLPRSRRHLRDICLVSGAWSWPLRRLPSPDSCVSLRGWPAVPSNTVAQESRREPSGRAGLLCTHLSGVRVHQTLVSLAACAVCVCGGGCAEWCQNRDKPLMGATREQSPLLRACLLFQI